jgi:hypothetical protein
VTTVSEQEAKLPGTVFSPRQVRILKLAVIVMGVLLVGGFAFVLAAIVYQASHLKQNGIAPAPVQSPEGAIDLPLAQGATVSAMSLHGNRLALELKGGEGPEIVVLDLQSGKIVARVKLKPQ